MTNEEYDNELIRLGKIYMGKDIEKSKCQKFCDLISKMKNKLIFWRR